MKNQWLNALKVVVIYLVVGALWILFSDQALELSFDDPATVIRLQTFKGWFYVLVTAILLYFLIKNALEAIDQANRLDPLTQLLRHQLFRERLEPLVAAATTEEPLALLFIDIDRFSEINHQIGIDKADRFLKRFAKALLQHSRASAQIARISTDQFALAIPNVAGTKAAEDEALSVRKILHKAAANFGIETNCSIGIAMAPMDGQTEKAMMTAASNALNTAKKENRTGTMFYNHELSKRANDKQALLRDLRKAIDEQTLSLVYQPQFKTGTLELSGVEVLLRWQHPKHGFISPDIFIPLAEDNGLISSLSCFVVTQSYKELHSMLGTEIPRVSVNISAVEFNNLSLIQPLLKGILELEDYYKYLQLEITETAAIKDTNASIKLILQIREIGLRLSLDDFGTGYSSLALLKDLPIDEVKIDRSFVFNLEKHPKAQSIVTALVNLANDFKISIVAEGVETAGQRELLHRLQCHEMQGFLLAAPQPVSKLCQAIQKAQQNHPNLG